MALQRAAARLWRNATPKKGPILSSEQHEKQLMYINLGLAIQGFQGANASRL